MKNEEKKKFVAPTIEVVRVERDDIITDSTPEPEPEPP